MGYSLSVLATVGTAGREHFISSLLLLVNADRPSGCMAASLQKFILDMPLCAQLLKNIKRIKILRSYVFKSQEIIGLKLPAQA